MKTKQEVTKWLSDKTFNIEDGQLVRFYLIRTFGDWGKVKEVKKRNTEHCSYIEFECWFTKDESNNIREEVEKYLNEWIKKNKIIPVEKCSDCIYKSFVDNHCEVSEDGDSITMELTIDCNIDEDKVTIK